MSTRRARELLNNKRLCTQAFSVQAHTVIRDLLEHVEQQGKDAETDEQAARWRIEQLETALRAYGFKYNDDGSWTCRACAGIDHHIYDCDIAAALNPGEHADGTTDAEVTQ